ncbi:hypothetical protein EV356DRAFT_536356 [Viridothelium virens]|uniref:Uncharacterized protein n=1 Tax=Viridothelium virens TaxID=1048519 RepID=A0A6A6GYI8_VIRVR|nr:hypothetical protein EV356DRAFT_536356 [Viridothelium virens]
MPVSVPSATYNQVRNHNTDDGEDSEGDPPYTGEDYERSVSPVSEDSHLSNLVEPSVRIASRMEMPTSTQQLVEQPPPQEKRQRKLSGGEQSSSSRRKIRPRIEFSTWWWLEIAALSLSLASTLTLLLVFIIFNKKSLSHWQQHIRISPNTFASIFVVIATESLAVPVAQGIGQLKWSYFEEGPRTLEKLEVFDKASRGLIGGPPFLSKLWRWPYRDGRAKKSALLATLGVIISIAAIAVGPFAQRSVAMPIRRVSLGTTSASLPRAQIYDTGSDNMSVSRGVSSISGAILNGIYNLQSPVPYNCLTANCTWRTFTTLGVCSSCLDVANTAGVICGISGSRGETPSQTCDWITPGGLEFMTFNSTEGSGGKTLVKITAKLSDLDGANIVRLAIFLQPLDSRQMTTDLLPSISECTLSWCGVAYPNATVIDGSLSMGPTRTYALSLVDPTVDDSFLEYATPPDFPDNDTLLVKRDSNLAVQSSLSALLNISLSEGDSVASPDGLLAAQIYDANDINATMDRVAISMTNNIRTGSNDALAYGEAWGDEQYLLIDMLWLLLPLVLIFLTFVLLFSSIVLSHFGGSQLWKNSPLPLLYHGLEGWNKEVLSSLDTIQIMGDEAKSMQATLQRNDEYEIRFIRA